MRNDLKLTGGFLCKIIFCKLIVKSSWCCRFVDSAHCDGYAVINKGPIFTGINSLPPGHTIFWGTFSLWKILYFDWNFTEMCFSINASAISSNLSISYLKISGCQNSVIVSFMKLGALSLPLKRWGDANIVSHRVFVRVLFSCLATAYSRLMAFVICLRRSVTEPPIPTLHKFPKSVTQMIVF